MLAAASTTPTLAPLHVTQVYEQVAERLKQDIAGGRLAPGQRLPSERDLAEQLEVGRSSVREAIGALQLAGLVETRRGAGSRVAAEAPALLARDVGDRHDAGPFALLAAREAFEPAVAAAAAREAAPDPLAERLLAQMDDVTDFESPGRRLTWSEADRLFHRQIGVMTHNPVMASLCDRLAELMDQPLWRRLRDDSVAEAARLRLHAAEHRMIYEAVVGGDEPAATFYAREHIRRVRRYMEEEQ